MEKLHLLYISRIGTLLVWVVCVLGTKYINLHVVNCYTRTIRPLKGCTIQGARVQFFRLKGEASQNVSPGGNSRHTT